MAPSFSRDEQLFVLAEIIKAGNVDIGSLVHFIKAHHIQPDWMSMQLPVGRNMNQCIQVAEDLSIPGPSLKRRLSSEYEPPSKKMALMDIPDQARSIHSAPILPPTQSPLPHVHILPRPVNGMPEQYPPHSPPAPPKKRGRPSRADKAKKDLRPLLPQHLAPRPPPVPLSTQGPGPNVQRTILPASPHEPRWPAVNNRRAWSPHAVYSTSSRTEEASPATQSAMPEHSEQSQPLEIPREPEEPSNPDAARPRVLAEGALDSFQKTSPLRPSESAPAPAAKSDGTPSVTPQKPMEKQTTRFDALIKKEVPIAALGPARQEVPVPVPVPLTNSA